MQLQVLSPRELDHGLMNELDAPVAVQSGSLSGRGALNAGSAMDTTPVLH